MYEYATLELFKAYRGPNQSTKDDAILRYLLASASRYIDRVTRRQFYPKRQLRYFDYQEPFSLRLDEDLLEVATVTVNNGDTEWTHTPLLYCGDNPNLMPYNLILPDPAQTSEYFQYTDTPRKAISIDGLWGYHSDYSSAWVDSLVLVETAIESTTEMNISITSYTGDNAVLDTPQLQPLQLIKIDDEIMWVYSLTTIPADPEAVPVPLPETYSMKASRGAAGTTAEVHEVDTPIYVFYPESDIVQLTLEFTNWLYQVRGQGVNDMRTVITGNGLVLPPATVPVDLYRGIAAYKRRGA